MPASSKLLTDSAVNAVHSIRSSLRPNDRIVFVSGNFNIVHPGHLRLLQFAAECGDVLVVGVTRDDAHAVLVPRELRLAGVAAIGIVSHVVALPGAVADFVAELKPDIVVKGSEYEDRDNPERAVVDAYGGRLLFGSGEARFSSFDLLESELRETEFRSIRKPADFRDRHQFGLNGLRDLVGRFSDLKVVVLGDLIVDDYIACEPLGMSQEDPTIVVSPIHSDRFVGGAGIVAAHASGLGARTHFISVVGQDATADFASDALRRYGVNAQLIIDDSRPTTLKQRYRANGKTLLRVSHLRQHPIGDDVAESILVAVEQALDSSHLLVFSDFNYGCLPQDLVDAVIQRCRHKGIMMVADSQASSQIGDVSRFKGMHLVTPTEHEARLSMRDSTSGLVVLAEKLREHSKAAQVFITLGAEGLLINAPSGRGDEYQTDQVPAMNRHAKDVSGAGDSLLVTASMALAAGATVWQSAYLGSIAAACQVGRMGNLPLSEGELMAELDR
jgi:rfaE bifunctional protein kinase chain/domain